ncbi:unnamed protein product [Clavelina lepadiformis]|uniref:Uncharacterized protein n=1 Tax=Clavelina lepadiformis TaxID=159417 RepID=A0ABP0H2J9_CLALP
MLSQKETAICVKCRKGYRTGDSLCHVGAYFCESDSTTHPLDTIIGHALKLDCETLVATLQKNKENGHITYIHTSCRTFLRNHARSKKRPASSTKQSSSKRVSTRSDQQSFDFKKQCFYCGYSCMFDERHPDRNKFEEVRTKSSGIYYVTLALCQSRDDELAKTVQARLLSAHDLVAAEARYHVPCRTRFENPAQYSTPGRPTSTEKMTLFNAACKKMEDDMDLYTVAEFHSMMQELGDDVYSLKMTQIKIIEKYGNSLRFVERNGKSKIILLDRVSGIIGEKWYEERDSNVSQETERIVKTAAKLIKDAIKNHEHESSTYPSVEDILGTENPHVPELLKVFMNELVMAPVKQVTSSQATQYSHVIVKF